MKAFLTRRIFFHRITLPCVVFGLVLFTGSCHRGKGLTEENGTNSWTLELDPHPDTVGVGVNDTIFVVVRQGEEARSGITVTFERNIGDAIPSVVTVVGDTAVPWGTSPMATYISRSDTGLAIIYGTAHGTAEEILARDTARVRVMENP
ncbi:MAG: hypothetical protein V1784_03800 [bacterium]